MICSVPKGPGVPVAKLVCDDCRREEVVPCDYERQGDGWAVNQGQALRKAQGLGWSMVKKKLFCQACNAKRKVVPMKMKEEPAVRAPNEPSRKQKREIMSVLDEVYDMDAGLYRGNETDETVAAVLGVMPGWVSKIRAEFFGEDGGNQSIEQLVASVEKAIGKNQELVDASHIVTSEAEKRIGELANLRDELNKIKKAVGRRVCENAGVSHD